MHRRGHVVTAAKDGVQALVLLAEHCFDLVLLDVMMRLSQRNAELEASNTRMRRDLEAAAQIQSAVLTRSIAAIPGVTFAWDFQTCESLVILTEIPAVGKHETGSVLPWQVISSLIQRGGILDAWMLKKTHDTLGKMKQLPHEGLDSRTHLLLVVRQARRVHPLL